MRTEKRPNFSNSIRNKNQRHRLNSKIRKTRISNKTAATKTRISRNRNRRAVPAKIKISSSNNKTSRRNPKTNRAAARAKILRTSRIRHRQKTSRKKINSRNRAKVRGHRRAKINSKRTNLRPRPEKEKTKMSPPRRVRPPADKTNNRHAIRKSRKNRQVRVEAKIKCRRPLPAKAKVREKMRRRLQRRLPHRRKNWPVKSKEQIVTNNRSRRSRPRN